MNIKKRYSRHKKKAKVLPFRHGVRRLLFVKASILQRSASNEEPGAIATMEHAVPDDLVDLLRRCSMVLLYGDGNRLVVRIDDAWVEESTFPITITREP